MMIGKLEKIERVVPDREPVPARDGAEVPWLPPTGPEAEVPTYVN